ncbi:MAG: M23 family metallopeptidase, partial [Actinomycetales bacterium]|nr:M23 family metallopeptidase [Actinomycetales bacterium]
MRVLRAPSAARFRKAWWATLAAALLTLTGAAGGVVGADQSGGSWQWPLPGHPAVVRHFDPPEQRWLPGHRGIDLAGHTYSPVLAVAVGTVTYSGSIAGVGIVSVTHPDGIRSTYQPVIDRSVSQGDRVRAGDQLGLLGIWGGHCALRACLHLGAVRGQTYLDPLLFLQPWELTLLPHGGW